MVGSAPPYIALQGRIRGGTFGVVPSRTSVRKVVGDSGRNIGLIGLSGGSADLGVWPTPF
jgi:hypothetical protein